MALLRVVLLLLVCASSYGATLGPTLTNGQSWAIGDTLSLTNAGGGGGAFSSWTNNVESTSCDSQAAIPFIQEHAAVINLVAGTVDQLQFYIRAFSFETSGKLGLYNVTSNLLSSGSFTVTGTGWAQVTLASAQTVTNGTYIIGWTGADNNAASVGYLNGQGTLYYNDCSVNTLLNPFASGGSVSWKAAVGAHYQ